MKKQITQIYFSPSGTTARIAEELSSALAANIQTIDLLKNAPTSPVHYDAGDLVQVAMPVFAGRVPSVCVELLKKLEGTNTPAIAVVVYGNREYEDALLELTDLLTERGFIVVGAAAFVAQHSIFPEVARGRPDANDIKQIRDFAYKCLEKLNGELIPVTVRGNKPYRKVSALPIRPSGNSVCTSCQACAKICPTGAIDATSPRKTDKRYCISCTACISVCPTNARAFSGLKYKIAGKIFAKKCNARKEPEIFT